MWNPSILRTTVGGGWRILHVWRFLRSDKFITITMQIVESRIIELRFGLQSYCQGCAHITTEEARESGGPPGPGALIICAIIKVTNAIHDVPPRICQRVMAQYSDIIYSGPVFIQCDFQPIAVECINQIPLCTSRYKSPPVNACIAICPVSDNGKILGLNKAAGQEQHCDQNESSHGNPTRVCY